MKTLCSIVLFLFGPAMLLANTTPESAKYNKQKRIQKAYKVNDDAGIDITNQFGPVFVTTWDEDKIELDIVIKVGGSNEDWVNRRLDAIDVDINALTTLVSAKTKFGHVSGRSARSSMEINYTVKIPRKGSVKVTNKYGDVLSTDLLGPVKLNVQYGNVKLANLNNSSNVFDLQYCGSVNIERVRSASFKADYSKLHVSSSDNVSLQSNYTDFHGEYVRNVRFDSNYGTMSIESADNIDGKGDYLTVSANNVGGNVNLRGNYSTINIYNIGASGGNIAVSGDYNTVSIGYAGNYMFDFDVRGKYTNMSFDNVEFTQKIESNKEKLYKGYHGKPGGKRVLIDGEYGNVSLQRNR